MMKQVYTGLDDFEKWELDAYSDGEEIPKLASFLDDHPEIREQYLSREAFFSQLSQLLDRFDCPLEVQLRDYQLQELSLSNQQQIQMHLAQCPHCAEELETLQEFMRVEDEGLETKPSLAERMQPLVDQVQDIANQVQMVVASLVQSAQTQTALTFRSHTVPTLQGAEQTTLLFQADDTEFSLMLQQDQKARYRIVGYILTPSSYENAKCKLLAADVDTVLLQADVDNTGRFVLVDMEPGNYQFILAGLGHPIVIPNLLLE
ncbi:hypothetical protein KFU94_64000 [Chloroflexi bacterium TSY]|nr:hypothetical protein [Chloroflexi bacterium TSY]